ncbi:MAG TPA: ATP-binding domain-containing protein, partial [Acidimicrobiia bacterium]|nr:ATP-binding domain-containing protein [Acidimicrobiia bacterium]
PAFRRSAADEEDAAAEAYYLKQSLRGLGGGLVPREVLEARLGNRPAAASDADEGGDHRVWRYAVVDEAQDLSPMEWRMVGRHSSRRAITVVGDVAQGTEAWSSASWAEIGASLGADDATLTELTINYRTPSEIAEVAAAVLKVVDPSLEPPSAIRSAPGSLTADRVAPGEVAARAAERAVALRSELGSGIACVVVPDSLVEAVRSALAERMGREVPRPSDPDVLDAPVVALTPEYAKGLEFDVVVVADPAALVRERGWRDLYVGLTRATQRLAVVHTTPDMLPTPSA